MIAPIMLMVWLRRIRRGHMRGQSLATILAQPGNGQSTADHSGVLAALEGVDKQGARALVQEAVDFARATGYQRMALWTNDILHAARAIYIAEGFKLVAEERHHSFGKDLVGQNWELTL